MKFVNIIAKSEVKSKWKISQSFHGISLEIKKEQILLKNPDLRQNRIKLVVRIISTIFLYKNLRFIRIF